MDEEIIDGAGGAEDQGSTGAPGSDPNEPGLKGSEPGAGAPSLPSSGEPPAGDPVSMEDAIRTGLASLNKEGEQPKPGEKKPVGAAKPGEGDPGLKAKPGEKPSQQDEKYRVPEGIGEQAQQRFARLANENKEMTARLQEVDTAFRQQAEVVDGFRTLFSESHVQPQELDNFCGYIRAFKTGDFNTAGQMLRQQVALFEQMTGRRFEGADPLGSHPDLRQAVDAMQITEEHALELARGRARDAGLRTAGQDAARRRQEDENFQQQEAEWLKAKDKALADIKAFSDKMQAEDIDWPAKQAIILKKVQKIVAENPAQPARWMSMIQDAYETIAEAASLGAPKGGRREFAPLTSGGKGGAGKAQPGGDMLSAIRSGLGYS